MMVDDLMFPTFYEWEMIVSRHVPLVIVRSSSGPSLGVTGDSEHQQSESHVTDRIATTLHMTTNGR